MQREAAPEEEKESDEAVKTQIMDYLSHSQRSDPNSLNSSLSLNSGAPLPLHSRTFFENRMGYDFTHVRIHNDSNAANASQSNNAKAFTYGNNIVFNRGQYDPGSQQGKHLLAHELTHVVQQRSSGFKFPQRKELHFYDPSASRMLLLTFAQYYCAKYSLINRQCYKRKPGKLHSAAYTVAGMVKKIKFFKSRGHKIDGIVFHAHGGPGFINLAKESLDVSNATQFATVSNLIQPNANIEFMGCAVGKGKKGKKFIMAIGRNLLRTFGGRVCGATKSTVGLPLIGIRVFQWPWSKPAVRCIRFGPFQGRRRKNP